MNYQQHNLLFFHLVGTILILTGCAPEIRRPTRICPGAESADEGLSILGRQSQNAVPLKANGQCRLQYYTEGKRHSENFPVKLWANPPAEIYLQGDVAFDPKGVVFGSNERQFWLSIKPKEVSSYWWGWWSEQSHLQNLMVSPKLVLEALGIAELGGVVEDWSLSNEDGFDILTRRDERGVIIKRVHIYNCDHTVRKIEYFDVSGEAVVVTELDRYKEVLEGFFVPAVIKVSNVTKDSEGDYVIITLGSIKPDSFTQKQRDFLFNRPEPRGFKHIYRIVDGEIIEQTQ